MGGLTVGYGARLDVPACVVARLVCDEGGFMRGEEDGVSEDGWARGAACAVCVDVGEGVAEDSGPDRSSV
jgi:hypothetical protein